MIPIQYPADTPASFKKLVEDYRGHKIIYPHLKAVTLAQWALESGWGTSRLATGHGNYGGMKWRPYMNAWASPEQYTAHDGRELYCHFPTNGFWIDGYWARLDRNEAYSGWKKHTRDGADFIGFIGPIWVGTGAMAEAQYVRDVLRLETIFAKSFEVTNETPDDGSAGSGTSPWNGMLPDGSIKKKS